MMGTYGDDREWSDRFIPQIKGIVGPLLLVPADLHRDAREATDLIVLTARDMRIAARVRRNKYERDHPFEFTIRSRRDTGAETEFSKIVNGWGDWLFYGFSDQAAVSVRRWMVIDLDVFRALHGHVRLNGRPGDCGEKANGDGTYFWFFNVRAFPSRMIVSSSHPTPCCNKVAA